MIDRRQLITSKQAMTLIISAMTGVALISLPYRLAQKAGHDGWIPILITGVISIIMAVVVLKLLKKYKDKSIFEINLILYGRYAGTVINAAYILYLALKVSINLRVFVETIHSIVLRSTPSILVTLLVLSCTVYLCWNGLKPICRFAGLIYIIMFDVLLLILVNIRFMRITFLMPVGESGISPIFDCLSITAYPFLVFAFIWLIYPMITDKDRTMEYTVGALIIATFFFMLVSVAVTGYFGENTLKHLTFPLYSLARSFKAPVVERIDLFFIAMWLPALEMALIAYFFVTKFWIDKLLGIRKRSLSLAIFSLAIIAISRIPGDIVQVFKYQQLIDIVGMPLVPGMAIIGHIFTFINPKGVKKK